MASTQEIADCPHVSLYLRHESGAQTRAVACMHCKKGWPITEAQEKRLADLMAAKQWDEWGMLCAQIQQEGEANAGGV